MERTRISKEDATNSLAASETRTLCKYLVFASVVCGEKRKGKEEREKKNPSRRREVVNYKNQLKVSGPDEALSKFFPSSQFTRDSYIFFALITPPQ